MRLEEDLKTAINVMENALDDHRGRLPKVKVKPAVEKVVKERGDHVEVGE